MAIVFDIETTHWFKDASHKSLILEERRDKRLTAADKKADNQEKILRDAALSPFSGEITVIGFMDTSFEQPVLLTNGYSYPFDSSIVTLPNEKELLEAAWERISELLYKGYRLVGFNSKGFDMPYLFIRSLINKVSPPKGIEYMDLTHPYSHNAHLDMKALFEKGSLKEIAYVLDCQTDNETTGAELPALWTHSPGMVVDKCKSDLKQSSKIYERIALWMPQRLQMYSSAKTDTSIFPEK